MDTYSQTFEEIPSRFKYYEDGFCEGYNSGVFSCSQRACFCEGYNSGVFSCSQRACSLYAVLCTRPIVEGVRAVAASLV